VACAFATIYYSYHEEIRILPAFALRKPASPMPLPMPYEELEQPLEEPALLLHARLIDDAIQLWDTAKLPPHILSNFTSHMETEMKFGILEWDVEPPAKSANFLDLTIQLEVNGSITTKTYVKDMNLHLYIPPASAHPPGVLKSLIFGNLQRYWIQNSRRSDFISIASAFYKHLRNRGYTVDMLTPPFQEAAATIDNKSTAVTLQGEQLWDPSSATPRNKLFVHWTYHPRDTGRQTIRQLFNETLAPVLSESRLDVGHLTIAYSIPRSLGQCLTKTQLEEAPDDRVSSYI